MILCLYYVYTMFILCLYYVYTMFILCLYYVYTMFILCLYYVYTMFIPRIGMVGMRWNESGHELAFLDEIFRTAQVWQRCSHTWGESRPVPCAQSPFRGFARGCCHERMGDMMRIHRIWVFFEGKFWNSDCSKWVVRHDGNAYLQTRLLPFVGAGSLIVKQW